MNEKAKYFHALRMRGMGTLLVFVGIVSSFEGGLYAKADDGYIQEQIRSEIKKQLTDRSAPHNYELRNKIQKTVRHELKNSGYLKKDKKKKYHTSTEKYLLPEFPYYALFYNKENFAQLLTDFGLATKSYDSDGKTRDFSSLIFGTNSITLGDVLLVSSLAKNGKLSGAGPLNTVDLVKTNHFLSILADQPLVFDAWEDRFGIAINFARHYCNDDVSFGIRIPVVGKSHRLRLRNDIDPDLRAKLDLVKAGNAADGTGPILGLAAAAEYQFDTQYPDGLVDLLETVLNGKNMYLNERTTTHVGLGDIDAYLNCVIHSSHIDRFVVGSRVVFPSAREADTDKIWGQELGNGGFVQLGAFFSMLWEKCCWFNPYIHLGGDYAFASRVTRRVAKKLKNGPVGPVSPLSDFILQHDLLFTAPPAGAFDELDSRVRRFGNSVTKVKIRPGAQMLLRLGNAFSGILCKGGAFDIHYDLKVKGRDYLGAQQNGGEFDASNLNFATWSVGHILGAQYSYQINDSNRIGGGVTYAVAGRNYPKELYFHLDLNFEF